MQIEDIKEDPYQKIVDYLPNQKTRAGYMRLLKKFLNEIPKEIFEKNLHKSGETFPELVILFIELSRKDIDLVKLIVSAYLRDVKNEQETKKLKISYVKNQLKPIVSLFDANEIDFSWKAINKSVPKSGVPNDRAYTREELQTLMLAAIDIIDKIIILLFSSAGFRLGAWDYFTWNDVIFFTNDDGSFKGLGLRIYAGDAEEYWTHGTPEAAKLLWLYREEWKVKFGKYPESSDPLIVPARTYSYKTLHGFTSGAIAGRVRNLLKKSGLKGINVQADNGFRKYFNTMCRRAKVFEEDREDMMGHYEGLQKHYERYVEEDFERFPEYQKAISILTISEEERAKHELLLKSQELTELQQKQNEIDEKDEIGNDMRIVIKSLIKKGLLPASPENNKIREKYS